MGIVTLRRAADFKRVRGGVRWSCEAFVIEGRRRPEGGPQAIGPRFGFTITRKVGSAVVRNRIRRRLKEALRTLEGAAIAADFDYVVVASRPAHDYPFARLQEALRTAFAELQHQASRRSSRGAGGGRAGKQQPERNATERQGGRPGARAPTQDAACEPGGDRPIETSPGVGRGRRRGA